MYHPSLEPAGRIVIAESRLDVYGHVQRLPQPDSSGKQMTERKRNRLPIQDAPARSKALRYGSSEHNAASRWDRFDDSR